MAKRDREDDSDSFSSDAECGTAHKMSKKEAEEIKAETMAAVAKRIEEAEKRNHVPTIIAHFARKEGGSSVCFVRKDKVPREMWDTLISWFCNPQSANQVVDEPMPFLKDEFKEKEPKTDAEKEQQAVRWWYDCLFYEGICDVACINKMHHRHYPLSIRNREVDQGQGVSHFYLDEEIVLHFTGTTFN
jgi:hypothetical protein